MPLLRLLPQLTVLLLLATLAGAETPPAGHASMTVLSSVPTKHKVVALTIDLGESATRPSVERLLRWLDAHQVKATFFVTGWFVRTFPDLTQRIAASGHELGNHTDRHPHCRRVSDARLREELRNVEELLRRLGLGMTEPRTFRPPYGEHDARVVRVAAGMGYRTVMWSATTVDYTRTGDADRCAARIMRRVSPGGIILTHATAVSAAMVPVVVTRLQAQGYEVTTLGALVKRSGASVAPSAPPSR